MQDTSREVTEGLATPGSHPTAATEPASDPFTLLGSVGELTGRTGDGKKDDGSETNDNNWYETD